MGAREYDSAGRVKPYDDNSISGEDLLVRYVHTRWLVSQEGGGRRLSKGAFTASSEQRDPYQSMSVDVLKLILNDGHSPLERKPQDHEGIVTLKAGNLRSLGLKVGHDPEDLNPYHAGVWGVTNALRKHLLRMCEWLDKPTDVS